MSTKSSARWRTVVAALASLGLAGLLAAQQDAFKGVERIVAVGDVHGDHDQFVKILRAAKVIDAKGDWIGGKTHLVQTGDVLDRAADSKKAMDLLMKLEVQAAKAGGAVHALIGNHEAMVLLEDYRYVVAGEVEALGGPEAFRKAFSATGKYGKWIRGHKTVVKINDVLFCHGGLTPETARLSLAQINKAVRDQLTKGGYEGIAMTSAGPLWDRRLAIGEDDEVAKVLNVVLTKYGANHVVVGHTVTRTGVETRAGGKVIRIDVGMSRYYRGPAACLVIEKGVFYEVRPGKKRRLPVTAAASRPAATGPATRPAARRPVRGAR